MDNSLLPRRTYLITYSQADLLKFPSREEFGKYIKTHFNKGSGKVKVQHWVCSIKKHQNGGNHYHVALNLTGPKRWKSVKESITSSEGIVVNFLDQQHTVLIDTSARKIHQSTTVKITLIQKIYPPQKPKSQQKLTGTLGKPSPLTCCELICCKDLLLLQEDQPGKLPSPKNQFATDVCIKTDIPIFATSKANIEFVGMHIMRDNRETEIMDVRWKVFEYHHRIPQYEQKNIIPCPRCFAELIFLGNSD